MFKDYFPFFHRNPGITYLDSAATSQCLYTVIEDQHSYNIDHKSNAHRSGHSMGTWVDNQYHLAKEKIGELLGIDNPHTRIVFTPGSSHGLADAVEFIKQYYTSATIYVGIDSHHSLLLPLQRLAKQDNHFKLVFVKTTLSGHLDLDSLEELLKNDSGPRIFTFTAISNVLGVVNDLNKIRELAVKYQAATIIDASQIVGKRNIQLDGFDFVSFSWHKVYGPTGLGTLIIDNKWLNMDPHRPGGGTVTYVTPTSASYVPTASKFEDGTQNLSAIVTIPRLVQWLIDNINAIEEHDIGITKLAISHVSELQFTKISESDSGLLSLAVNRGGPEDYTYMLDAYNIMIRSGKLCAEPLINNLTNKSGLIRLSWGCYTSNNDIELAFDRLGQIYEKLR